MGITPPPPFRCQEVNVFHSFSPLRTLLPREMETPSSLDSKWAETSPLLLTVLVFSLTPRDVVVPPVTIWLSLFQVFNLERKVMMSFSEKTTRLSMSPLDVSKWKSTRSMLKILKSVEFSLPHNLETLIWDPRYQRKS